MKRRRAFSIFTNRGQTSTHSLSMFGMVGEEKLHPNIGLTICLFSVKNLIIQLIYYSVFNENIYNSKFSIDESPAELSQEMEKPLSLELTSPFNSLDLKKDLSGKEEV